VTAAGLLVAIQWEGSSD